MKKYKNRIITGIVILIVLALVFLYGGNMPGTHNQTAQEQEIVVTEKQTESMGLGLLKCIKAAPFRR